MECFQQINIANPARDPKKRMARPMMLVPCGRCLNCTQRHARGWAFRLWHQNKEANHANFITLTYNNESLPINEEGTYPEFDKTDVINFIKRLRRKNEYHYPEMGKMKYYLVGEYGSLTGRPHYHVILFNSSPKLNKDLHKLWFKTDDKSKKSMGNLHIGDVSMDTICYVTGYVMKRDIYKSDELNRKREFSIMSKGLGAVYIRENFRYHQENLTFETTFQGQKMQIPDHFRRKIFDEDQRQQIGEDMVIEAEQRKKEKIEALKKLGHKYPEAKLWEYKKNQSEAIKNKLKKDKF